MGVLLDNKIHTELDWYIVYYLSHCYKRLSDFTRDMYRLDLYSEADNQMNQFLHQMYRVSDTEYIEHIHLHHE